MSCLYQLSFSHWTTTLSVILYTFSFKIPLSCSKPAGLESLVYSQVICRHGTRNPLNTYGKYTENYASIWPEGYAELTDQGKDEALHIGNFLRERYAGFLSKSYKPDEIFVLSSGTERTIKTAEVCMLGLYEEFHDSASWGKHSANVIGRFEPIPIRTIPSELDNMLSLDADCPKRKQRIEYIRNSNFDEAYFSNDGTLEYVLEHTGQTTWSNPNATFVDVHWEFYNALEVITALSEQNKTLEDWMVPLLSHEKFLSYKYHLISAEHASDLPTHRLHIGALIELLIKNFKGYLTGARQKKLDVFIGHDKNLLSLGWTLGINSTFGNIMPPPESCIVLELHDNPMQDEPTVEIWYRKGSENAKQAISSLCGYPCTFSQFVNITTDVTNVDYGAECEL